jgi:hypothetical protein
MKCDRCQGWMVNEKYYGSGFPFWGWRCVACGEILDPVISENRNRHRKFLLAEGRGTTAGRNGR